MNFIQVISSFTIGVSFLISLYGGFSICEKNEKRILEIKKQVHCEKFIAESFRKTCEGKGFEDLNQWQECCRAMWNLEYIGWANVQDFMIIPDDSDFSLVCGVWRDKKTCGEVYSKIDKE